METVIRKAQRGIQLGKFFSCSLLIAGTTIGAGMLGIPLVSAHAGFIPSALILFAGYLFMLATGYLFLEVALKMPQGSNILSMAGAYLGKKWQLLSGGMFLFLYYCLLVAYFASGAPLIASLLGISSGPAVLLGFASLFGLIVVLGFKWVDRVNWLLIAGMVASYFLLIIIGSKEVTTKLLLRSNYTAFVAPLPVLFSAFGFHNVIPSICTYCERDKKTLVASLLFGTSIPLIVYLLWQYILLGSVSQELLQQTAASGSTAASALQSLSASPYLGLCSNFFAFFAIVTSLLGVSFSVVDFLKDGFSRLKLAPGRPALTLLTFAPPALFALLCPKIFTGALGVAGGIGEAFLNGLLPVMLVFSLRYLKKEKSSFTFAGGKPLLFLLFFMALFVMALEFVYLLG